MDPRPGDLVHFEGASAHLLQMLLFVYPIPPVHRMYSVLVLSQPLVVPDSTSAFYQRLTTHDEFNLIVAWDIQLCLKPRERIRDGGNDGELHDEDT